MLLLVARPVPALDLRWGSGATTLTFASATRCTLVVRADSAWSRLPSEWRLLWVADSASVHVAAVDSIAGCALDEAQAYRLEGPRSVADSVANLATAHFCSAGAAAATIAVYVLDQPGGSRGRLKVVALDPGDQDSSRVVESNQVTYNGGVDGDYEPVVLHASSVHRSLELRVTAVGAGLLGVSSLSIVAPDTSWSLPLNVAAKGDGAITGVAPVAALLPACDVRVTSPEGIVSSATLPADGEQPLGPLGLCSSAFNESLLPPPPNLGYAILPKDFSFAYGFAGDPINKYGFHLFYTRHSLYKMLDEDNEKRIGHAVTVDDWNWTIPADSMALEVRPNTYENLHVWAPTIVQANGPTYYMFYTSVRLEDNGLENQRIALRTSTDLNKWAPVDTVLTVFEVPWASTAPQGSPLGLQIRDPFVMEDPINPGQWLMYFVSVDKERAPKMAVGVARSSDLVNWRADPVALLSTEKDTPTRGVTTVVESPHVFKRKDNWWLPYTVNNGTVFFETTASADPTDTTIAHWTFPDSLQGVTQGNPSTLLYWHASEYLQFGGIEYLAAYNDNATEIDITQMTPPLPQYAQVDSFQLGCPPPLAVPGASAIAHTLRLSVRRMSLAAPEVGLRLEVPARMHVRLAVYDIAGRRRDILLDRELPGGVTEAKWDGRDESGARVPSGMYFVRMSCEGGVRISKVVMLR